MLWRICFSKDWLRWTRKGISRIILRGIPMVEKKRSEATTTKYSTIEEVSALKMKSMKSAIICRPAPHSKTLTQKKDRYPSRAIEVRARSNRPRRSYLRRPTSAGCCKRKQARSLLKIRQDSLIILSREAQAYSRRPIHYWTQTRSLNRSRAQTIWNVATLRWWEALRVLVSKNEKTELCQVKECCSCRIPLWPTMMKL